MPPLETLADAMVTQLNTESLSAPFVARWGYDPKFVLEKHKATDPADVLILVSSEETSLLTRATLQTEMSLEIVIQAKLANQDRATVLGLRQLCESIYYLWAPPQPRAVQGSKKIWTATRVDVTFDPEAIPSLYFFSLATLTFGITR
jgi:hypothetical protein